MTRQRSPHPRRPPRLQRGFTLIELMIALLLGVLVIGGVISVFLSNKQAYTTGNALNQVQDSSRVAFEMLARDIRESGLTGCGNTSRIANVLNNGPVAGGTAWYADMANSVRGYDAGTTDPAVTTGTSSTQRDTANSSSIELVGGDGAGVSIASHSTTASKMILNESNSNLLTGDLVIVCDPDHAVLAQATTYTAGAPPNFVMAAGTTTPGNCSTGLGYPTQCSSGGNVYQYAVNAMVSKVYAADWYIGYNPQGGKSLYRMTLVNSGGVPTPTAQEMVRNVSRMSITYHVTGGTTYVNAATVGATNWGQVDSVMLSFQLQSATQYTDTTQQPLTRQMYMTVTLRNRV